MLRLTVTSQSGEQVVLAVDGWLTGSGVDLLKGEIDHWLGRGKRLVLDLNDMRFVDPKGISLLHDGTGEKVVLQGGSAFVRELLRTHGLRTGSGTNHGGCES